MKKSTIMAVIMAGASISVASADRAVAPAQNDAIASQPAFVRAEDTGEDFAVLESGILIGRLAQSDDTIVQRKAAKVIGDRSIDGTLDVSEEERTVLNQYIDRQVQLTTSATGEQRQEANQQLQRLWRAASDKLIDNLSGDGKIPEAVIKNLALMRDKGIVEKIIARTKASDDAKYRRNAVLALGVMRGKRDCLIPNRTTLGDEESLELAVNLIIPFLKELQAHEADAEVREMITTALHLLDNPPDSRLRPSASPQSRPK